MGFLDTEDKLALLGYAARHDLCGTAPVRMSRRPRRYRSVPPGLYPAVLPDGNMACLFQGLFLSSGIPGEPDAVMKDMIDVLELLRTKHAYKGYIHVKILPGTSRAAVERACQLADRASINLEFPNSARLCAASARKDFKKDLLSRLAWLGEIHRGGLLKSGLTTQFVVGASGESDAEILST